MLQSFIKLIKIHMHHYIHITKIKTLAFFFREFYGHECWDYLTIIHNLCITLLVDIKANPTCNSQHYFFIHSWDFFVLMKWKSSPQSPNNNFFKCSMFSFGFHHFTTIPKLIFTNNWFYMWNLQFFDIMETIKRC